MTVLLQLGNCSVLLTPANGAPAAAKQGIFLPCIYLVQQSNSQPCWS